MGAGALLIAVAVLALVHTARAGGEPPPKPETYVSGYDIVNEYPHDPTAFTQGLAFGSDGTLYESDGLYRHSAVRVVELNTGKSIKSFANPSNVFGEGLVVHDNKLIQLSWKENVIHELTVPDLTLVRSLHKVIGHEGWGLASDGATLYVTDSGHELFHVDPATYEIRKRMPIIDARLGGALGQRVHGVNELEWVEGELWGNVYPMYQGKHSECVVRINATSGEVRAHPRVPAATRPPPRARARAPAATRPPPARLRARAPSPRAPSGGWRGRCWAGSTCAACSRSSTRACARSRTTTCSTASRTTRPAAAST